MATAFDGAAIDLSSQITLVSGGENLRICMTCGECVSRCFLTDGYPDMNPRKLIREVLMGRETEATVFVELWPNRKYSICCGEGGSVGQNTDMGKKRPEHARMKHDQIMSTGAEIIATSCQNCLSQLGDLQARYNMPVEVKSVIELLVESMEA